MSYCSASRQSLQVRNVVYPMSVQIHAASVILLEDAVQGAESNPHMLLCLSRFLANGFGHDILYEFPCEQFHAKSAVHKRGPTFLEDHVDKACKSLGW